MISDTYLLNITIAEYTMQDPYVDSSKSVMRDKGLALGVGVCVHFYNSHACVNASCESVIVVCLRHTDKGYGKKIAIHK